MAIERVTPNEAAERISAGWRLIDVRSVPEFEEGHPTGAYNVPIMHRTAAGRLAPNPDFLEVMKRHFAEDARLVIGCRSGNRSMRAAEQLVAAGYQAVVDMRGGYSGEVERSSGALVCAGWSARDLPTSTVAEDGREWSSLSAK